MLDDLARRYQHLISSWVVPVFDHDGPNYRIKAVFDLVDGSRLHVRQVVLDETHFIYAYHWQDGSGKLIRRWDNAPHWPSVSTFPDHKHVYATQNPRIFESPGAGDLECVFEEIASILKSG